MECVTVVDCMEGYDLLLRVFIHGESHVQVPVPILPTFFHVTFPVIGKGTSTGADQRHYEIDVHALRVKTVIILSFVIFRVQHGGRITADKIPEAGDGPAHGCGRLVRIVLHMKPQFARLLLDVFHRVRLSVKMLVYAGKQMYIVHNLSPRDRTGFLAAFAHDFLHGEYIADLFHQFDTAGQRQMPRVTLGDNAFQFLYGFFYHFLCILSFFMLMKTCRYISFSSSGAASTTF